MKAIVIAVVFCIGVFCAAPALAQSDTAFSYQGELKNNGDPVDGMREFEFTLWNARVNGTAIGGAIYINDVELVDGLFNVELDFGADAFNNDRRWLQIEVEGEVLSPRQEITRSPYSIQTRGIFVDENERVGIGMTAPSSLLHVADGQSGASGVVDSLATLERNDHAYLSLLSPDNFERGIFFGGPSSNTSGGILYNSPALQNGFQFRTNGGNVRAVINSAGNVGIGLTTPSSLLHVADGQSGASSVVDSMATLERGDHVYLSLLSPDSFERGIFFGGPSSNISGGILYNSPTLQNGFQFRTNGNRNRMVINDDGNVGVGLNAPNSLFHVADGLSGASAVPGSLATLERDDHAYLSLLSPDNFERGIFFGDPSSNISGGILYNNPFLPNGFQFRTNGNQTRMVITDEGSVGIGTDDPLTSKLRVVSNLDNGFGGGIGILGETSASDGSNGVFGWGSSTDGGSHGVTGSGSGSNGTGIRGLASHGSGVNFGVRGRSSSPNGYDFYAYGDGINYGADSSIRWKSNVVNIEHPLEKIAQLRGVYFDWDEVHGGRHDMGMIAEEVGKVLPEIVGYEENGIDAVGMDYSKLTPLLVEAMNALRAEKDAQIEQLKDENQLLRARLDCIEQHMARVID